jgi:2-polyprenyl-6-methoxyphenol hydroxylase-like FAD-dependent oxidoreductase
MPAMAQTFDVCIRGSGIVGRTLALLLARDRLRVALVGPSDTPSSAEPHEDVRAYALNATSRGLLQSLRAWPDARHATPVARMEIQGDQDGCVHFDAAAQGVDARLHCTLPHGQIARQWFQADGSILAFLPLGGEQGNSVAIVWSVPQEQAPQLLALEPEAFAQRVQEASHGALGALELVSNRAAWPLQQARANHWCGNLHAGSTTPGTHSWVLAGDAAHNVHPLAGQGLNLGLADVQALARTLMERDWRSIADLRLLRRYERERKAALLPMGLAMDGLQQLFARREAPLQALRNWGLKGFERSGLLKEWTARQAMGTTH